MPRLIRIDAALINIDTIDRIDDALNPGRLHLGRRESAVRRKRNRR
jgi:hypothetical protein